MCTSFVEAWAAFVNDNLSTRCSVGLTIRSLKSALSKALDHGIGSGGQGYNTRHIEIAFLIEFAIEWKKLTTIEEQQEAAADPWAIPNDH